MKRVISLVIAAALLLTCAIPAFAQTKCDCGHSPVVIVSGMGATPMIQDKGTPNEKDVFPPESIDIPSLVTAILKGLSAATLYRDWNRFADAAMPEVKKILEPIACNPDGTSKYNVTTQQYDKSMAEYTQDEVGGNDNEFGLLNRLSEIYGADHVYFYNYNWRLDPMDHARELHELIQTIKKETGHDKVTMASCSMGGAIAMAYLSQYGSSDLDGCIFLSTVFFGTFVASELFTKQVALDPSGLTRLLAGLDTGNATINAIMAQLLPALEKAGLTDAFCELWNHGIDVIKDRIYDELLIPVFAYMPGLWAVVDAQHYDEAKKLMLDETENAELIKKIDVFHNEVSLKKYEILKSLSDNKVKIAFLANYNAQNAPLYPASARQGDGILETELMSAGATCAKLNETLPKDYVDAKKPCSCGATHISPDHVIDASTCLFPEFTWFGKNWPHVCGTTDTAYTDLILWIITYDGQPTVHTNPRCPQFFGNDHHGNMTNLATGEPLPRGLKWFDGYGYFPQFKPNMPQSEIPSSPEEKPKAEIKPVVKHDEIKTDNEKTSEIILDNTKASNDKQETPNTGMMDTTIYSAAMLFALCTGGLSYRKKKNK